MAKRVLLHVGAMKSGTSYLQHLCQANRPRLREAGILWPGSGPNFAATQDLLGIAKAGVERQGAWDSMLEKIESFDGDVLISNEMLLAHPEDQLRTLVDAVTPAQARVVITARDLARVIPSQWQTAVRTGKTVTWSDFAESVLRGPDDVDDVSRRFWKHQDLRRAVRMWSRIVGPEYVVLVTVPRASSDPTLFSERFLTALGAEGLALEPPTYRNVSLGVHSAELVRRLNEDMLDWDWESRRIAVMVALNSRVLESRAREEPRLSLSAAQHARAAELAAVMVERLRRSGVSVVGDLADLLPGDPPTSEVVDPASSPVEELLAAAQAGLVGLAREYADLAQRRVERRRDDDPPEDVVDEDGSGSLLREAAVRLPGARSVYRRLRGTS
jgi:hypothetical protein